MFGELTDLLSKKFAIGYLLPVVIFTMISYGIMNEFQVSLPMPTFNEADGSDAPAPQPAVPDDVRPVYLLMDDMETNTDEVEVFIRITISGMWLWFGGVLLLVMNRAILRVMEGYGEYHPAKILDWLGEPSEKQQDRLKQAIPIKFKQFVSDKLPKRLTFGLPVGEQKRFEKLKTDIEFLKQRGYEQDPRRFRLIEKQRAEFPEEARLLPTSFGNAVRAFEDYSRLMYGLDAIPGWNHLQTVISSEYSQLVSDAKANLDFWASVWFLSLVVLAEYLAIVGYRWYYPIDNCVVIYGWLIPCFVIGIVLFAMFAFARARNSAVLWGYWVKAAFDVFLSDLREKLGLPTQPTREAEREMWEKFSQAIIYRHRDSMPER